MRQMKNAMDVGIRTRGFKSLVEKQSLRTTSGTLSPGARASALRGEVLSELPEQYREAFSKLSPRQQEKMLSQIEGKVDRKIQNGSLAKKAVKFEQKDAKMASRAAKGGRMAVKRYSRHEKYRLQETPQRNGEAAAILSAKRTDPRLQKYVRGSQKSIDRTVTGKRKDIKTASDIRDIRKIQEYIQNQGIAKEGIKTGEKRPPGVYRTSAASEEVKDSKKQAANKVKAARKSESIRQAVSFKKAEAARMEDPPDRSQGRKADGIPGMKEAVSTKMLKQETETLLEKAAAAKHEKTQDRMETAPGSKSSIDLLQAGASKKEIHEIEKSIKRVEKGRISKSDAVRIATAGAVALYQKRFETSEYRENLVRSGITSKSEKAAIQMQYEKKLQRATRKAYSSQLRASLLKNIVRNGVVQGGIRKMQHSADEELDDSWTAWSTWKRAVKNAGGGLVKAVRNMFSTKAVVFLIPIILAMGLLFTVLFLPFVTILPLMTSATASYQDENIYPAGDATELIEYAKQWIGKIPYVWGGGHDNGTSWQNGCDCSGFVTGVFRHFGYSIGTYTGDMENLCGTVVGRNSLANAQPGDVLIYYRTASLVHGDPNGSGSYHTSIYIGDGKIIHQNGNVNIANEFHSYFEVRRVITGSTSGGLGGKGTGGHRVDATNYSQSDLELIWAVVGQEDNGSYEGALAVISTAMNRVESPAWSYCGSNALQQLKAPGQFCYSNDRYWVPRLGGNVPQYVKQAVNDCLKKGIRNHNHTSFRSTKGKVTGNDAVQIGGNWYFGS